MKNSHIYSLFGRDEKMHEVLSYGVDYGMEHKHAIFTLEHIIYGFYCYCEDHNALQEIAPLPWYSPEEYLENSNLDNVETVQFFKRNFEIEEIEADIDTLCDFFYENKNHFTSFCSVPFLVYFMITYLSTINAFDEAPYLQHYEETLLLPQYNQFLRIIKKVNNSSSISSSIFVSPESDSDLDEKDEEFIDNAVAYSDEICLNHTTDLTYLAYQGNFNHITGRTNEIQRVITIITRMLKNNVVLIGNPGVGKSTIVYGLCQKLVDNEVPDALKGYHVIEFNFVSSIAGSKFRGDFEERINNLFEAIEKLCKQGKKIILFFDEIHEMMDLGNSSDGAIPLSSMMKPFLLKSDVKIIGTSTFQDYKKIEKDSGMERRFDTITVEEPSFDEAFMILYDLKKSFESNYNIQISNKSLKACIEMSQQYITDRYLPDKALNLLDDACSIKASSDKKDTMLSTRDIAKSISLMKGIPIDKIHNVRNFANIEAELQAHVIGQDHAISSLVKSLKRTGVGLNDENKPIGSFLFVGSTGVGKTEIAKALAEAVFSEKSSFVRFDMSEYMEEHSISKLIGSPPGYVNHEEGGLLTEKIRRHPYSLVLFDEIEKAHPKIFNILLQILDEGMLTDSSGNFVNFRNTIIILTSNVGSSELNKPPMGFGENPNLKLKSSALSAVKSKFAPELLNRLDEIIYFNQLTEKNIMDITKLCICNEIVSKLTRRRIEVHISKEVIKLLAKKGYSIEYGVRELKRTITNLVKNPIADFLIKNGNPNILVISLNNDEVVITSKETVHS